MVAFTKKELDKEAYLVTAQIRRDTGKAAKLVSWKIYIHGEREISLAVVVQAYDGLRQRHVAI